MSRIVRTARTKTTTSEGLSRKIRVGILVEDPTTQAWAYEMLERIQSSEYAEIIQVVQNIGAGSRRKTGMTRVRHIWKRLCYAGFSRIDKKLSRVRDDPFVPKPLRPLLDGARWIEVSPIRRGFVDRFRDDDLERMATDEVDVYLRLGFGILKGDVLMAGRLGIWSYHHGDNRINRGLPPGFWEVHNREAVTGVTLQVLGEELDAGRVLYRSFSKTNSVYVYRSICGLYWKSTAIIPRVLKKLHRLGYEGFNTSVAEANGEEPYYTRPLYTYPSNWQTLKHVTRIVIRLVGLKFSDSFFREQWLLMYRQGVSGSSRSSMWRYKQICPPPDRFWADPFVLTRDGEHHIFFEELIYANNRGTIAHLSINEHGKVSEAQTVMEKPYHLSYPFVFEHNGDYFMIPESSENRSVDLYRCSQFPGEWTHVRTLIDDMELVDATVIFHEDRWWLFAGQRDNEKASISEELSIFYSDDLFAGDWTEHPCNPVVSDIRCARPAGKLFYRNGNLYRPAQDCRNTYGGAIDIRKVDVLTTERYEESHASGLAPDWQPGLVGLHTLNQTDELTVIDVVARRSKLFDSKHHN